MLNTRVVICDIDETIARLTERGYYDWDRVGEDEPIYMVIELLHRYKADHVIVLITGRSEVCREATHEWLQKHNVPYDFLYMKEENNGEDSAIFKERIYLELKKDLPNPSFTLAIDDRQKIIDVWKKHNVPSLMV